MDKQREVEVMSQRLMLFEQSEFAQLKSPCTLDNGIVTLSTEQLAEAKSAFNSNKANYCFFIPASGSGSRMFSFLYDYLNSGVSTDQVELFFKNMRSFAFYDTIPMVVKSKIGVTENTSVVAYLLSKDGMGFGTKPKGLIPFHTVNGERMTPFQEHVISANRLFADQAKIHFTIQKDYSQEITLNIEQIKDRYAIKCAIEFSVQDPDTDAFCFDDDGNPVMEQGEILRRPSGHGAILKNLNAIDSDYILIKNIDNTQPIEDSELSEEYWRVLSGLLIQFEAALAELSVCFDKEALRALNERFQFLSPQELASADESFCRKLLRRPSRVCGMVKNEGKPGGGPFWIDHQDRISKQIVESSQISAEEGQQAILRKSTYFNPVFMVVSKRNALGEHCDYEQFRNDDLIIKVTKKHRNRTVHYRELPGLWNGGMYDWNTIFVEVPAQIFTPVKSVMDLLEDIHKG